MIRNILIISAFLLLLAPVAQAVDFDHAAHQAMEGGPACTDCHKDGADSIKPAEKVCLKCHDQQFLGKVAFGGLKTHGPVWALNHRQSAKAKVIDCEACHQQVDCLGCHKAGFADEMGSFTNNMINVHTSDFHVTHPIAARTDPQRCTSCHEPKFCNDCHNDFAPADLALSSHRRGWRDGTLGGAHALYSPAQCQGCHTNSVLPAHEWSNQHAREARKNLVTCQACHPEGDVCMTCHSAVSGLKVNPHPAGWDKISDRIKDASGGSTCRKCH